MFVCFFVVELVLLCMYLAISLSLSVCAIGLIVFVNCIDGIFHVLIRVYCFRLIVS